MAFTFNSITSSIIDVASGSGTLSELYADAIANTAGCMTNPSSNTYQVENNRELEINSATLRIETGDTLQWNRTSNGVTLEVTSNASIIFEPGSTFIGDTNGTHMAYNYFYGGLDVQGTSGSGVLWDLQGRNFFYPYGLNGLNHTVDYLTIQDFVTSSSYGMQFEPGITTIDDSQQHSYTNIIVKAGPTESTGNAWLVWWRPGSYHNYTFENIDMTNGNGFLAYGTSNLVVDGGTALNGDLDSRFWGQTGGLQQANYTNTVRDDSNGKKSGNHSQNQNKTIFKNYTFDDGDLGAFTAATIDRSGVAYFESCTFQNAAYVLNVDGHAVLYNPTFTNITGSKYSYTTARNGTVLHARKMTLTVEDSGGSPIADATVMFKQKEGREFWVCKTDSNGAVLDGKDEPIWLIENEEATNGVLTQWSDGTGDQVHVVEVYKTGYEPYSQEYAMTQDRTVTVVLQDEGSPTNGTLLNGVTINSTATFN